MHYSCLSNGVGLHGIRSACRPERIFVKFFVFLTFLPGQTRKPGTRSCVKWGRAQARVFSSFDKKTRRGGGSQVQVSFWDSSSFHCNWAISSGLTSASMHADADRLVIPTMILQSLTQIIGPGLVGCLGCNFAQTKNLTKIRPGWHTAPTPFDKNTRAWARPHLTQLRGLGLLGCSDGNLPKTKNLTKIRTGRPNGADPPIDNKSCPGFLGFLGCPGGNLPKTQNLTKISPLTT